MYRDNESKGPNNQKNEQTRGWNSASEAEQGEKVPPHIYEYEQEQAALEESAELAELQPANNLPL